MVPYYEYAMDMILDCDSPSQAFSEEQQEMIETAAEMLYGLIHARYILTNRGLAAVADKFTHHQFGTCPRVYCGGQAVLPVGESDLPRTNTVKVFCPRCENLLFHVYPEMMPSPPSQLYTPRIYGFKIHPSAKDRIFAVKQAKKAKRTKRKEQPK